VTVHTGKGTDGRHDLYWGRTNYAYPNKGSFSVDLWKTVNGTAKAIDVIIPAPGGGSGTC
jgi:hypothetical protein